VRHAAKPGFVLKHQPYGSTAQLDLIQRGSQQLGQFLFHIGGVSDDVLRLRHQCFADTSWSGHPLFVHIAFHLESKLELIYYLSDKQIQQALRGSLPRSFAVGRFVIARCRYLAKHP
jgi:hypothetical protein